MKRFNYHIGLDTETGDLKTFYIDAPDLASAREQIKALGHAPVVVQTAALVLETYKGHDILDWDGSLTIYDPKAKTRFIVALDDSKSGGKRRFLQKYNNLKAAKKHIDWCIIQRGADVSSFRDPVAWQKKEREDRDIGR